MENTDIKVTINTIQRTAYVKRMDVPRYAGAVDNILLYDLDNLYPNKCKSIAQRSGSLSTALGTLARFLTGQGFQNYNDLIVNSEGLTILGLLKHAAREKASFGVAWHVKYNIFGHVAEVVPLLWEQVRKTKDGKFAVRADWSDPYNFMRGADIAPMKCTEYNPDVVLQEFEACGGFQNHTGQILYYHNSNETYPLAVYDSVLDDAQLEAEAKIYALSNIQNEFGAPGVLKIPGAVTNSQQGEELESYISKKLKGSKNRGNFITIPLAASLIEKNINLWEPFNMPNVDTMHENQLRRAKENIYEKFQQPGIVNGRSDSGMFNQQSMQDTFAFYNSITEADRQDLETVFNLVFAPLQFQIVPLSFIQKQTIE